MDNKTTTSVERIIRVQNGWVMLVILIGLLLGDIALLIFSIVDGVKTTGEPHVGLLILSALLLPVCIILMTGFFTLQPNQARVLMLFGAYKGTARTSGFHWGNPFYSNGPVQFRTLQERVAAAKAAATAPAPARKALGRNKISLRARNLNGEKLKVNDKRGNPIE